MSGDKLLNRVSFGIVCLVVLLSPWLFGAWEAWWFWPFALLIFLGGGCLAIRCFSINDLLQNSGIQRINWVRACVISLLPFLLYAMVRTLQTDVAMTAERSLMLFVSAFLLGALIVCGFTRRQLRLLFGLIFLNLLLVAIYGVLNHLATGSRFVLWRPGYEQYWVEHRASGCFYCPNHYAGAMELLLCMALGTVAAYGTRGRERLVATATIGWAIAGVVLSKSRGGQFTLVVIIASFLLIGLPHWRSSWRWAARLLVVGSVAACAVFLLATEHPIAQRLLYFPWQKLENAHRYQMASAAMRAWNESATTRVFGVGPGMHQNLWLHIAPSPDGDREAGVWPQYTNETWFSYEVHSDWVQLLEEYGIVGVFLFLVAIGVAGWLLLMRYLRIWRATVSSARQEPDFAFMLAGLLAAVTMSIHSLGDFNLQIPGVLWMTAALVSIPLGLIVREA